jgi:hypothetical protein
LFLLKCSEVSAKQGFCALRDMTARSRFDLVALHCPWVYAPKHARSHLIILLGFLASTSSFRFSFGPA